MSGSESNASLPSEVSRRDVLRFGAGAGVLGLTRLSHATPANADEVFVVKPYLQLGDAPRLRKAEQMVVMWHAVDDDSKWRVEFREGRHGEWVAARAPQFARVAVGGIAPHEFFARWRKGMGSRSSNPLDGIGRPVRRLASHLAAQGSKFDNRLRHDRISAPTA